MIDKKYINDDGIITVQPYAATVPGDGNGLLQTGLAIACEMYPGFSVGLLLDRCRKSPSCPLIWRSPHKNNPDDSQEADDYWSMLPLNQTWADEIYEWGLAHKGNYDVQEGPWSFRFWFSRFPAFTPFLKHCAGYDLNFLDRLRLAGTIYCDALFISNADSNIAAFCRIRRLENEEGMIFNASAFWYKRIRARYTRVGRSWAAYFGEGHPLNDFDD